MKAVLSFGGYHFVVPVDVAIQFGLHAKEVDRQYDGATSFDYHEKKRESFHEIEVKFVDESAIVPLQEAP